MPMDCTQAGLVPKPERWEEYEEALAIGEEYMVEVKKKRSVGNHRRFWAFLKIVFDMQELYDTKEDLRTEIKLRCGHYEEHLNVKGDIMYIPKSMSFEDMDEVEFKEFFNKAIDVALRYFCPKDLKAEELNVMIEALITFG